MTNQPKHKPIAQLAGELADEAMRDFIAHSNDLLKWPPLPKRPRNPARFRARRCPNCGHRI
ncbi:MAG TPA: hypothetical protein VNA25_29315 [Phycisphaerae bacterium]|nr:hypothetical protein [Phycisphaerae bacterium]